MADKVKHIAIENSGGTTNYDIYDENSYVEIGKVDNKITNINNKIGTDNIGNKTITKAIKDLQESSTSAGVKTVDNIQPDSNGNIDLSDKYLKQKHEEKQGNTLEIGHVKLTDTLPAGVPDAQVNGVETVTAASGYAVQKVREDLTTKITEVSNKIPENIGTVISVNGQKPNNAGAVIVTGSDIDYKTFLSGEVSSSIADKFEEIDNKLLYSQKIAPILTEDFSPAIRYIEIKGLTFGDGDEAVNYKFASDVAANPSVEANPPVLNSITINGVDYAIKGGEGGGGQTIQVSTLPEASIGYLDVIYQYIGEDTEEYTNGYFYKCISELVEEEETYKWKAISVQKGGGGEGGTSDYDELDNKPKIAGVTLIGDKSLTDLGIINFDGDYEKLTNKPDSFTPSAHTHSVEDITNLDLSTKVDVAQGADNKDKILKVNAEGNLALAEDAGGVDVSVENQVLKFKGGSSGTSSSIHEYSTTEHIVGKWIDGSDIWERTYDMSGKLGNKTDGYINVTEDIGKVIRFFGYGYSTTSKITIGFPHTNLTNDCCIFYNGNTKTIHLAVDADYSGYNEVYVTLQYLK